MPKYSAVITILINEFEAFDDEQADDIATIVAHEMANVNTNIFNSSDVKIQVDTFTNEDLL
jgi:hypothetical protein